IGFASTSSLAMRTLSFSEAISSRTGATMRHGPHQVAQKSTKTGVPDLRTSCSKFASVTTVGFPILLSTLLSGFRRFPFTSRENPLLPLERQLLSGLFHRRFQAEDRFQAVEPGIGVRGEGLQWDPLYEPPATASNRGPQGRRALQFERGERTALVGDREEAEHAVVVGYLFTDRGQTAMQPRGPVELPEEHHLPAVVPREVYGVQNVSRPAQRARERRRLLLIRQQVRQHVRLPAV